MSYRGGGTTRGPLHFVGTTNPGPSSPGTGLIYFDSTTNTFQVSQNGSPFNPVGGSSGWSETGSVVSLLNANDQVGIGTATPGPTVKLQVDASAGSFSAAAVFLNGNVGVATATPHSKLHVDGSFAMKVRTVTTNAGAGIGDAVIAADASASDVTVTLPSAVGISGRTYYIKKIDSTLNQVFVQAFGVQTIDGLNIQNLSVQYESMQVVSDGAGWLKI